MSIYKGYDIRGTVPDEISPDFAHTLGKAFPQYLAQYRNGATPLRIAVARDNRASSELLTEHLIKGLTSQGVEVIDIGLAATPVFYFAVDHHGYDGGIMVTASHNPPIYNGFKLVRKQSIPIGLDSGLKDIQNIIETNTFPDSTQGSVSTQDVMEDYVAFHEKELGTIDASELRVVVDTGNGVSVLMVKPYLESLNTNLIPLYFEMDGSFPNHEPNPLKYENIKDLCETVKKEQAHMGIALDADGDRVIFVDERGEPISSDYISVILAESLLQDSHQGTVLYDIRSSHVVRETIEKNGGTALMTRVGHAYIKHTMREHDALFTGELSGHFYFKSTGYFEAPLLVIGMIFKKMLDKSVPLSALIESYKTYSHTGEINFEVADKKAAIQRLTEHYREQAISTSDLDGITMDFGDWWFNVRPSNTEDLLRLNLEAKTPDLASQKRQEIESIIRT